MYEHPNAAVVRRVYEAQARGDTGDEGESVANAMGDARTPLAISAVGEVAVVIDCKGPEVGIVVFRVVDGRAVGAQRLMP